MRASVVDYRVPIEIDGVSVRPGDLVIGDVDGVLIVPQDVEDEVLERVYEKAKSENIVRRAIE